MVQLSREFYARPALEVARALLGMHLCHRRDGEVLGGRIVEVEAYLGPEDRASHARLRKGRGGAAVPTPRAAIMFGPPGFAYVYLIYGLHHCFNAVAHPPGGVGAVLVRALEPGRVLDHKSCAGPARLCAALGIDLQHNGLDLCTSELFIADRGTPVADEDVATGPRIGVDYAGADAAQPYRLADRRSPNLSRKI